MSLDQKIAALTVTSAVLILLVSNVVLLILLMKSKNEKLELNEKVQSQAYVDKKVNDSIRLEREINDKIDHKLVVALVRVLIRHYFVQGYEINLGAPRQDIPPIEKVIFEWIESTKKDLKTDYHEVNE